MTRPDGGDGSDALSPGTAVCGRYRVERELGRGGMATVYLARDLRHDRMVALKMLQPELSGALGTDRFLREISIAAGLQHPNILPLFDSGTAVVGGGARPFYVMPYVAGESLRARLQREIQLGVEEAIEICRHIAAALDYAHGHGIVHRDIKPENILLEAGRAVVADFGLATALDAAGGEKLTHTGLSLGTPAYMSPEQATGRRVDPRADVYSLACVMYEMLVGDPPFVGSSARAVMARHALDPVPSVRTARPEVPSHLEAALWRGLAKVPGDRFASAGEFADAVAGSGPVEEIAAERLRQVAARAQGLVAPSAAAPAEPQRPAASPPAAGVTHRSGIGVRFGRLRMAGTAMVLLIGAALAWTRAAGHRSPDATVARSTIAMTPLVNATGDTALDYLAAGLAEAINGRLAVSSRVVVAGRSAAISRAQVVPVLEEGRIRGADAVLAGRLVGPSGTLTLEFELYRVADGSRLWSERFDLPLREVVQVEERIAQAVLARLDTVRGVMHRDGVRRPLPANHEAHLLLLRGLHATAERTPDGFRRGRDLFLRSLEWDPVYAEAYAGLAGAYQGLAHYGAMAGREAFPRARAAALRALQLDSTLAQARTGLAAVRTFYDWDFAGAEREYREALQADPNDPVTHNFYGIHLRILGRFDEAGQQMEAASRLDPLARVYVRQIGLVRFCAGDYPTALAQFRRALELEPGGRDAREWLIETLAQMGRFEEAIDAWRSDSLGAMPDELRLLLARARGKDGYQRALHLEARLMLDELRGGGKDKYVAPSRFARLHATLGQWDSTLVWLDRAAEERDPGVLRVACDAEYIPIRSHPQLRGLMRRLGLPQVG